jgi:hypothetical protein
MVNRTLAWSIGLALAFIHLGSTAIGADGDAISLDLKTFKFKTTDENASLFGYDEGLNRLFFYTFGTGEAAVKIPTDGDYELVIEASCDPAQNERAKFKAALNGQAIGPETLLTADEEREYKLPLKAKAGEHKLSIEFTNDLYKEGEYDRNLYVHSVTLRKAK